jgi:hypothetical protein
VEKSAKKEKGKRGKREKVKLFKEYVRASACISGENAKSSPR